MEIIKNVGRGGRVPSGINDEDGEDKTTHASKSSKSLKQAAKRGAAPKRAAKRAAPKKAAKKAAPKKAAKKAAPKKAAKKAARKR